MESKRLLVLFHQDETAWRELYRTLYQFPFARHVGIPIQQFGAKDAYPAFFYYTEDIAALLTDIIAAHSLLVGLIASIPPAAVSQFMRTCMVEEIKSSNDIEGVNSTRKEIRLAMDEQNCASRPVRLWSIVNKYKQLQEQNSVAIPLSTSEDLRRFYDSFILDEILRDDPKNQPDGKLFRKFSVDVWSRSKVIHRGVSPEDDIICYMDKALELLNNEAIPGLVRVAAFHYLFGYIHPFYDGNGRISRFIASYYLSWMIHPLAAMRLSITIKKSIRSYYRLFKETNEHGNCGDLTPFITGFLLLIKTSMIRVNEILAEKREKLSVYEAQIHRLGIRDKNDIEIYYILLQAALFSDDGATLDEIASVIHRQPRTIRDRIKNYPKEHIEIDTSHRAHRFKLRLDFLQEK